MSAKLTRKALEVLRDCDMNKLPCSECLPHKPPEQACYRFRYERGEIAALALRLAEELEHKVADCPDCLGVGWFPSGPDDVHKACRTCESARALLAELEG